MQREGGKIVSVFGLGYVGCVSAACLAKAGHQVIGVEINDAKVDLINKGIPTIVEPGLDDLLKAGVNAGRIRATIDAVAAIRESDVVLVTVGTPSKAGGELDLSHIHAVAKDVGKALREESRFITVAIRSTVKPGTCDEVAAIIEECSGKHASTNFSVVSNPEFLREGSAIADYENPPYVLIGSNDERGAAEASALYTTLGAEILVVNPHSAEIIKYVNNAWHALKVAFGNEVGAICKSQGIDSEEVVDLFLKDRVLNISPHYLRPGYAFGGACLPKDLSALVSLGSEGKVDVPLLGAVHASNQAHIARAISLVKQLPTTTKLGFLGVSFKNGTDDVRNSPTLDIIRALGSEGYEIRIFDSHVDLALTSGRNAASTRAILGDTESLIVRTTSELLEHADVIVVTKKEGSLGEILEKRGSRKLIDLVCLDKNFRGSEDYTGLAW